MIPKTGIAHTCHLGDIVGAHMSFKKRFRKIAEPLFLSLSQIFI